jgi:hypothetical protein
MASQKFLMSKFDESIAHAFVPDITFPVQGLFVVELPDGAQIDTPTDYTDLKTKKAAAFASLWPDFPSQVYNELDTTTSINAAAANSRLVAGKYEWMLPKAPALGGPDGVITTNAVTLGATPVELVVFWTCYAIDRAEGAAGKDLSYRELAQSSVGVEISVDNGANYTSATHATPVTPAASGTQMILRFTNTSTTEDRYLGYYVVMYRS